ncbi:MAG: hypothetical protein PHS02_03920 [Candidatus ainarchaeum sp.]|nr:hypothetical protein [Candidatus ainarchaeum sp.]
MAQYEVWKTRDLVDVSDAKNFEFPHSGEKILLKKRPPIAKTSNTD